MKKRDVKIDFVIAWGGEDQERFDRRVQYLNSKLASEGGQTIDASDVRYRDWDNLQYWLRCVEAYAPWVNRVHLITCGFVPDWLNTEHPKLNVVKHSDYIPEEYLPTFSSHPIELNLHRISDLSEHFVYFNDDFFLTAPVKPEDFFVNGVPCDELSESPIHCNKNEIWLYVQVNDLVLLNRHFSRRKLRRQHLEKWYSVRAPKDLVKNLVCAPFPRESFFGMSIHHLPQPYLKQTFEKVWELEPEVLHQTCTHRFRDYRDVSQCVMSGYQRLTWQFRPYNFYKNGKVLCGLWDPQEVAGYIEKKKYKMLCINDHESLDFETARDIVNRAFEKVLPEKSAFER